MSHSSLAFTSTTRVSSQQFSNMVCPRESGVLLDEAREDNGVNTHLVLIILSGKWSEYGSPLQGIDSLPQHVAYRSLQGARRVVVLVNDGIPDMIVERSWQGFLQHSRDSHPEQRSLQCGLAHSNTEARILVIFERVE